MKRKSNSKPSVKKPRARAARLQRPGFERKPAEATRRDAASLLSAVLHNAPITIFATDSHGVFTLSDGKGLEHVGFQPGENVGVSAFDLYGSFPFVEHTGQVTAGKDVIRRVLAGETVTALTELNGVYFENHIGPLWDKDGKVIGVIGVATDITERKQAEKALRELSSAVEQTADHVFITDRDGVIQYVNAAFEKSTGYTKEEVLGKTPRVVKSGKHRDEFFEQLWQTILAGEVFRAEFINRKKNGELYFEEKTIAPIRDAQGNITHFVSTGRDVTERKRAEEELRKNYELLNRIFATTHFCVVYLDRDFNFVRVNKAYADACGYSPEFFVGKNHFDLYPGEKVETIFRNVVATGTPFTIYANPFQFPDHPEWGVTYWDWTLHPLRNEEGYVEGLLFALLDVTERKRAEEERARLFEQVHASRERLRRLARQVVFAQEEERQRISHELHDEAGQALTALKISLGLAQEELPANLATIRERLSECIAMSETTLERIHLLAQNLRPPGLDAVGLGATLEGFCLDFARQTQLSIDYVGMDVPALPEAVTISFYRFLQDALTNVVKHARASHVKVVLNVDADAVSLSVEDDGQGFDVQSAQVVSGRSKGIGLIGMQERFGSLGGHVEIVSQPGQGTRLIARVPRKELA